MRRLVVLACLVALAAPGSALAVQREAMIHGSKFSPTPMHVLVGDTVRWTNHDFTVHDVLGDAPIGASGDLTRNATYPSGEFTAPGTYQYRCTKHVQMRGSVVVHDVFLRGPAVVFYGAPVNLTGLAPNDEVVDVVRLGDESVLASPTASGTGAFAASEPATLPQSYQARLQSDTTKASPVVNVAVKPRVTIAKKRIPLKRWRITVRANIPNHAGAATVLQRKTPRGWVRVASKPLNASSTAVFTVRPKATWRVRALVKPKSPYLGGQSAVIALKRL